MLTRKQLEDAARCNEFTSCRECKVFIEGDTMAPESCGIRAAQTALAYRAMLERHMWHKRSSDGEYFCVECRNNKKNGHKPDCELAAMLRKARG